MKKRFIVRFMFTGEFEAENDSDALASAAYGVKYGIVEARHMELKVVAVIPIVVTPQPVELPATQEAVAEVVAPTDDTMPF